METVLYDVRSGVATITMNRPDVLNALDVTLATEMAKAIAEAGGDPAVRAVVITGAGRGFCAGADLGQLEDAYRSGQSGPIGDILRDRYNPMVLPITQLDKPVIAAVNGVAAGAGASIAFACDFRIASDKAKFFQAFIKIGLIPDCGANYFLPRLVGMAKALELAMLGDVITAETALEYGLVTKVVSADTLIDETQTFAEQLASGPSRAFGATRRSMMFGAVNDLEQTMDYEADAQHELAQSGDHKEGVLAFLEKRTPNFQGR
ncbi:MAG: enoyl-CoA hydratase-related protein [Actinomycetota bacterium]|nr:enoyl-CoA hydratase/isomerase family protein [Actinomycetota bacterium]